MIKELYTSYVLVEKFQNENQELLWKKLAHIVECFEKIHGLSSNFSNVMIPKELLMYVILLLLFIFMRLFYECYLVDWIQKIKKKLILCYLQRKNLKKHNMILIQSIQLKNHQLSYQRFLNRQPKIRTVKKMIKLQNKNLLSKYSRPKL